MTAYLFSIHLTVKQQNHLFPPIGVIIPAAGIGSRMNSDIPKQFLRLAGKPVIAHTCLAFLTLECIDHIIVVVHPEHGEETKELVRDNVPGHHFQRLRFVRGGVLRQDSVREGLDALDEEVEIVLVHDAARPLIDHATIIRTIEGAREKGAVIAAIPVRDTLKRVGKDHVIETTIDRSPLWQAQTPQAAETSLLKEAFAGAAENGFQGTDEASLIEHHGTPVSVVQGNEKNIKITYPGDLELAETILSRNFTMKIGHGYDAHRLVPDRKLILGGVEIDHHLGLAGHSDADVVAHALMDAILGALGCGDIGKHFPDTDNRYRNISSILLLEQVTALMESKDMTLGNADITIVCQKPRLAPHIEAMRNNFAEGCNAVPEAINIKATTTEKMGFSGRGEGIAAHAVVLLRSTHGN